MNNDNFYIFQDPYDRASTEDVMASPWDANARQALLQKCINNANEASTTLMEGPLWLKAEGKKSWKKFHFILRDGNLFQTTKSKKGSVHDVHCVASLATIRVFNGIGWKRKHKAPTDFCLALKPPEVQEKRAHIRYLCAENEFIKWGWYSMLRLTLGPPQQLVDNYNAQLGVLSMEDEAMMIGRSDSMVSNASSGCISEADEETGFDAEYPEGGTIKRKPAQQASPPHLGQHIAPGGGPMAAVAAANPHAAQMQAQHAAQAMEQHRHLVNMEAMQSRALNGTDGRPTTASSACSDETLPLPPPPVEDVPQVLTPTNVMNSSQMLPPPPPSNCTPDKDVGGVAAAAPGPYLQQQHQQHQQHQHPPAAAVAITSPNQPMGAIREDIYPCGVIRTMFPGGTPEEGITTGVKQMNLLQQMPTQPPPNLQALLGKQEPFNRPTNGVASAVQPQFKAQPSSSKEPGARQKKITFSEFVHSVDDAQWEPLKGREDGMPVNCANTSDEHYNEKDVSNWVLDSLRHCSTPSSTAATTTTATSAGSNGSATALSHSHVDSLSRPKLYNGRTVPNCFSPEEVAQQQRSMMVASVTAAAPVAITEVDSRKMPPPPPRRSDGTHLSQV